MKLVPHFDWVCGDLYLGELTFCSMVRGITALCAMFEERLVLGPVRVIVANSACGESSAGAEDRDIAVGAR